MGQTEQPSGTDPQIDAPGQLPAKCKLTVIEAKSVVQEYRTGVTSIRLLAKKYGVSKTTVHNVLTGKRYPDLAAVEIDPRQRPVFISATVIGDAHPVCRALLPNGAVINLTMQVRRGRKYGQCKLTDQQVQWARDKHERQGLTVRALAATLGVSKSAMGKALLRRSYCFTNNATQGPGGGASKV